MAIEPSHLLFTVDEYEALGQIGFFGFDRRLELIEGEIFEMTPIGPDHGGCVVILTSLCIKRLGDRAAVSAQGAVVLGNLSEPQPDLMVLAGTVERYRHRHPRAEDVLLLIEVSDSTLRFDRKVKLPAYARAGVVEVWIVDLKGTAVEIHRRPTPEGYAFTERRRRGDTVSPEAVPDLVLTVDEILG
ncbi:MAG: Uma2 family endonuclease [Acidimicrobiales bacterium]